MYALWMDTNTYLVALFLFLLCFLLLDFASLLRTTLYSCDLYARMTHLQNVCASTDHKLWRINYV